MKAEGHGTENGESLLIGLQSMKRRSKKKKQALPHMESLNKNVSDVQCLLDIASRRKLNAEKRILRQSAVVLFTASWEAYIEDLATASFKFLTKNATSSNKLPDSVKRHVVKRLEASKDPLTYWQLAEGGWKETLRLYARDIVDGSLAHVNTPNNKIADEMFEKLIGLKNLSNSWQWRGTTHKEVKKRLTKYITLRGQIAHRNSSEKMITTRSVQQYIEFIFRLAVMSNNTVVIYLQKVTGKEPWRKWVYGKTS